MQEKLKMDKTGKQKPDLWLKSMYKLSREINFSLKWIGTFSADML